MYARIKEFFTHEEKTVRDNRWIFTSMLVGAILSLIAAFVLSLEAIELAKNPDAKLSCSINAVFNCATVAKHPSAEMLGFPNSFIGMMAEPVVITVAIAGLAGIRFQRGFMFAAQIGYTLGLIYAYVLFYISFFIIEALCPWCLLVTLTTTMVWFALTRYNIRENNLFLAKNPQQNLERIVTKDYDKLAMFALIFVLIVAILVKYGNGFFV
ncbi:MAG TPA: vitamin K epoxide reductase family protein [Candidatus Saccharibacteria bacterium]|nr:vitamin K epoxide reductase family protein [Candidatus Saccharibacteria bacterium]